MEARTYVLFKIQTTNMCALQKLTGMLNPNSGPKSSTPEQREVSHQHTLLEALRETYPACNRSAKTSASMKSTN